MFCPFCRQPLLIDSDLCPGCHGDLSPIIESGLEHMCEVTFTDDNGKKFSGQVRGFVSRQNFPVENIIQVEIVTAGRVGGSMIYIVPFDRITKERPE